MRGGWHVVAAKGRWVGWALVLALAFGAVRTTWYAVGPPSESSRLRAQVTWLNDAVDDSAAERMQGLFPEGEVFTLALTALATARAAEQEGADRVRLTELVTTRVGELSDPTVTAAYLPAGGLENGIFLAGWRLHAQLAQARLSGSPEDADTAVTAARRILTAVEGSSGPFLEAYPGQVWPVDTVVAMAAVADVDRAFGVPLADDVVGRWVERARALAADGLVPHHVGPDMSVLDGPRGSSGALALSFLPSLDPEWSAQAWEAFVPRFVTRVAGAVGVREFESGSNRSGDVDSGPLIAGVSLSASAVAVAAARANGSPALAADLMRQAEVVGLPIDMGGSRRYALGALPVGDAFLAWARSTPEVTATVSTEAPRPLWWVWVAPWLLGIAALVIALRVARRRRPPDAEQQERAAVQGP
ncbi:hypothetical protein [Knoellia subterranea]|uniref:Uncharacterized protein n=1 Tax=Knoellia subterranea KCTC 19937 TaxID=1385521 RepID=A0A0A0JIH6_9MICO|nr:hypothetical protein [Knoellia subterranea]KGN35471.1 hypothetical protein N803_06265 [Knoellia subterranea KCTC 19937]